MTWYPIDLDDTNWGACQRDDVTLCLYTFFQGNANAKISYEVTVNYEFIPNLKYDIAGVRKNPLGSPEIVAALIKSLNEGPASAGGAAEFL